jgi:hypothetical protein
MFHGDHVGFNIHLRALKFSQCHTLAQAHAQNTTFLFFINNTDYSVTLHYIYTEIPVATWSKACTCGHSPAGMMGSKPAKDMGDVYLVSVLCCQVEVSSSDWSLVQRRP